MQGSEEYITQPDGFMFAVQGIQSRDFQRRKHHLDLAREKALNVNDSELLKQYLPVLLRLAYVCPFDDVRAKCRELIDELKVGIFKVKGRFWGM